MKKLILKFSVAIIAFLSSLYGIDKKDYLLDHGFIEKDNDKSSSSLQTIILEKDFKNLLKEGEKGSVLARLILIHFYIEGIGIEKNIKEGEKWMLQTGNRMMQIALKDLLELFKDDVNILQEIIQNDQIDSRDLSVYKGILGYLYLRGWGVEKNYELAFRYLKESADLENVLSNVDLGKMYQEGLGTEKDLFEAYHRYRFAAEKGLAIAYYRLGIMYEKGIGVEKNSKKAEELFQKASSFIQKHNDGWKIGGKIHFEQQSSSDYLGTLDLNKSTRETLKEYFDVKDDSCAPNAKVLIKNENGNCLIKHYEERAFPHVGEEMHATLLYTTKRVDNGHETLRDIYENLLEVNQNLPADQVPSVEQIAQTYQKLIKPDWKFEISDVQFVVGKTGSVIIAKLLHEGKDEIVNESGNPVSGNFLHLTLVNIDLSLASETEKINLVVTKLREKFLSKKIKIGNRKGFADLEFGISGSKERIRPNSD